MLRFRKNSLSLEKVRRLEAVELSERSWQNKRGTRFDIERVRRRNKKVVRTYSDYQSKGKRNLRFEADDDVRTEKMLE